MRVLMLFPPLGSITHPYLSLPSLAAFLRCRGHDVRQSDIGVRAIDALLMPNNLRKLHSVIVDALDDVGKKSSAYDRKRLNALWAAYLCADHVIENIETAKRTLRSSNDFYDPVKYLFASNIVKRALDLLSAAHYPTRVMFNDVNYGPRISLEDIERLSIDEAHNPFIGVLRDLVVPGLLDPIPDVIGISVTYYAQIVGAYTVARLIKKMAPDCHITMGGAAITASEKRIRSDPLSFGYVDSYVFGEGETALETLLEIVGSNGNKPNTLHKLYLKGDIDRKQQTRLTINNAAEREQFDALPCPDYDGLNLADYLSPEVVFLLSNARGCYYRKCSFCNVSLAYNNGWQERSFDTLRRDLIQLQSRHNAKFIMFADDCVSPRRCRELAAFIRNLTEPIFWQSEVRFEKAFTPDLLRQMYEGGCRQLMFGNESACQRVLNLMNKGTSVELNKEIIHNTNAAGIAVHVQNFLGFPGENKDEAEETVNFIVSEKRWITSWAMDTYHVTEFSPVHHKPNVFGVVKMKRRSAKDLVPHYDFNCLLGLSRAEIKCAYEAAMHRLNRAYPCQQHFFDGVCGAHLFLFITRFGLTKIEELFPGLTWSPDLFALRPRALPSVRVHHLPPGSTVLYSPTSGRSITLKRGKSSWFRLINGRHSLEEIVVRQMRRRRGSTLRNPTEFAVNLLLAVDDLYVNGFIDFEQPRVESNFN